MKSPHFQRLSDLPLPAAVDTGPEDGAQPGAAEVVSRTDDRRTRGLRTVAEIAGEPGETTIRGLRELAPDLADWIVEFAYGEVMARPGLDRRSRQLATIAALTALGNARPQLETHIRGALNVGCQPREIIEVILQMAVFAGFPAAINALGVAREVLPRA